MKVANPIYDIVFKYMMEDERIARTILSALLKVEVLAVEVRPHEYSDDTHENLSVFRIDFGATIRDADGNNSNVDIVLKKIRFEEEAPCFLITLFGANVTTKCIDIQGITREKLFSDKYYRVLNLFHQMYVLDEDDYVMTQLETLYEEDEDLHGILCFLAGLLADADTVSRMKEEAKQSWCHNRSEMLARYESFVQTSLQTIGKDLDIVTRLTKD